MQHLFRPVIRQSPFHLRQSYRFYAAVGDSIPSTSVFEGSPGNDVDLAQETGKGKSLLVGVPGAFSPGCSQKHIPGYIENANKFKSKGIDNIFVLAVNDPFVTKAWGEGLLKNGAQVRFLADSTGDFTRGLDLLFDASKVFGNERSKRYALLVEDGKIKQTFVEPDNTSVDVSDATKVLSSI
ncbi:hypothetical protein KGF57_003804 [Candida theae]|uniref:Thioredoxin domain-containing protein n=1 Tax=Candida theae TaxID=1198502 RepID=A0AAD5FXI4_9ASCO|nr:uncharacterized protein KGF57_003804 [Candida theae]KAI5954781.1 hypothetical protein KGF57_003804 [Candida theae]